MAPAGSILSPDMQAFSSMPAELTRGLRRAVTSHPGGLLVIGLTFLLLGLMILLLENFRAYDRQVRSSIALQLYLHDNITMTELYQLGLSLQNLDDVRSVEYKSRDAAYSEMQRMLGDELLPESGVNPFPNSVVVYFSEAATTLSRLEPIADELEKKDFVDQVDFNREWLQSQEPILEFLRVVSTFLALLVFAAAVLQILWAVNRTAASRMNEIEVLKISGAGWKHLGLPLMLEGSTLGIVSSILGLIALYLIWHISLKLPIKTQFISTQSIIAMPLVGLFSGFTAGYLMTRRLLR